MPFVYQDGYETGEDFLDTEGEWTTVSRRDRRRAQVGAMDRGGIAEGRTSAWPVLRKRGRPPLYRRIGSNQPVPLLGYLPAKDGAFLKTYTQVVREAPPDRDDATGRRPYRWRKYEHAASPQRYGGVLDRPRPIGFYQRPYNTTDYTQIRPCVWSNNKYPTRKPESGLSDEVRPQREEPCPARFQQWQQQRDESRPHHQ